MQIKVYAIDVKIPRWAKRALVFGVIPALLLGAVAVVVAQPPETFSDNELLSAKKMNDNFSNLQAQINNLVPAGTVVAFASETTPTGWLPCDGKQYNALDSTYAALYAAIGTLYGGNTSSKVFNVPDYRGMFLRGWNNGASSNGATIDPDASARTAAAGGLAGDHVGSVESDALQAHMHTLTIPRDGTTVRLGRAGGYTDPSNGVYLGLGDGIASGTDIIFGATGGRSAAETRPKNAYVNYIIKL
jgi:rhizosphere induced protein